MTTPAKPHVIANGEPVEADLPCTIDQFLLAINLPARSVVVELNGTAVAPSEFADHTLQPGDKLEIVQMVGGG